MKTRGVLLLLAALNLNCFKAAGADSNADANLGADAGRISQACASASDCRSGEYCDVTLNPIGANNVTVGSGQCVAPACGSNCLQRSCDIDDDCAADQVCDQSAPGYSCTGGGRCCLPTGRCAAVPSCGPACQVLWPAHRSCFVCACPSGTSGVDAGLAAGSVDAGPCPNACDDHNACTADTCDPVTGCRHEALTNGASCASGVCCSSKCTNTATDRSNCGSCGGTCPAGQACVAGLCSVAACAQPFAGAVSYPVDNYNTELGGVADLNGDGRPDIAVASYGGGNGSDSSLSVLMNNGDGTFSPAAHYSAGGSTSFVAIGDVNADGKPDLVATAGDSLKVLLNNGDGTFVAQVPAFPAGAYAIWVTLADLDGDGKLDAATANAHADSVTVLLGKGDGTFAKGTDYPVGSWPNQVVAADLNGDGKLDLVSVNMQASTVSVLINQGNGTFVAHVEYPAGSDTRRLAVGDVNGDGKPDLVASSFGPPDGVSTVSVLLNRGDGTFPPAVAYLAGGTPLGVAIGDVNGDGNADLVVCNLEAGTVSVLLNSGTNTFPTRLEYPGGANFPSGVAIRDVNGDGNPDLVVSDGSGVGVLLNQCP